jgi:hypothetical protein
MHNKYVIGDGSSDLIKSKPLLLDTNFVIDTIIFNKESVDLIAQLRALNCDLITTRAVLTETLGGTKDSDHLKAKITHLELLFQKPFKDIVKLPIERELPTGDDILKFSRQCNKFDTTDFELYLTLKKYCHTGIMLITRNHTDFTSTLFERNGFITLFGNKEIKTYGLYSAKL